MRLESRMLGWISIIYKFHSFIMEIAKPVKKQRKRFESVCLLGSGSYGDVYGAYDVQTKKKVAIKKFKEMKSAISGVATHALREISILRRVSGHKSIVTLLDVIEPPDYSSNDILMVMQQEDCDLEQWLQNNNASIADANAILLQLLKAGEYLHSNFVMHRDIKPDNILINEETMTIKLTDFGQARQFGLIPEKYTLHVQAMYYRAPELLLGCSMYSELIDVWSIGCVYAEILGDGEPLFGTADATAVSQIHQIFRILGTPTENRWASAMKWPHYRDSFPLWDGSPLCSVISGQALFDKDEEILLNRMLALDPAHRCDCNAALEKAGLFFHNH